MSGDTGGSRAIAGKAGEVKVDADALTEDGLRSIIDYTLLKPEAESSEYHSFLEEAARWRFGGVFVPPCYLEMANSLLADTEVIVGCPISFPFGYCRSEVKAHEAVNALERGARELDVVMNVSKAVSGDWDYVEGDLVAVVNAVREWEGTSGEGPIIVKVILETPYLEDDQKAEACRRAGAAGCDFVKTATGLGPGGATAEDVRLMRGVVEDSMGVKASGGIRNFEDVMEMLEAGASRIGTSTGPGIMEDFRGGESA